MAYQIEGCSVTFPHKPGEFAGNYKCPEEGEDSERLEAAFLFGKPQPNPRSPAGMDSEALANAGFRGMYLKGYLPMPVGSFEVSRPAEWGPLENGDQAEVFQLERGEGDVATQNTRD